MSRFCVLSTLCVRTHDESATLNLDHGERNTINSKAQSVSNLLR